VGGGGVADVAYERRQWSRTLQKLGETQPACRNLFLRPKIAVLLGRGEYEDQSPQHYNCFLIKEFRGTMNGPAPKDTRGVCRLVRGRGEEVRQEKERWKSGRSVDPTGFNLTQGVIIERGCDKDEQRTLTFVEKKKKTGEDY